MAAKSPHFLEIAQKLRHPKIPFFCAQTAFFFFKPVSPGAILLLTRAISKHVFCSLFYYHAFEFQISDTNRKALVFLSMRLLTADMHKKQFRVYTHYIISRKWKEKTILPQENILLHTCDEKQLRVVT